MRKIFLVLIISFFVYSCVDMYGTPQERAIKNSRMSDYGLCEKLGIAVLAPAEIREEWAMEVQRRNVNCNQYAGMINSQRQANQQLMNQGLQLMEQSQPYTLGNNNSNGKVFGSAFYKRSYVSGMNRICVYDNMGSDYTTTVGAAELCPMSID